MASSPSHHFCQEQQPVEVASGLAWKAHERHSPEKAFHAIGAACLTHRAACGDLRWLGDRHPPRLSHGGQRTEEERGRGMRIPVTPHGTWSSTRGCLSLPVSSSLRQRRSRSGIIGRCKIGPRRGRLRDVAGSCNSRDFNLSHIFIQRQVTGLCLLTVNVASIQHILPDHFLWNWQTLCQPMKTREHLRQTQL